MAANGLKIKYQYDLVTWITPSIMLKNFRNAASGHWSRKKWFFRRSSLNA